MTRSELGKMTIADLKALARKKKITLTGTLKDDIVKDLAKDEDLPEVNRFMFLYRKADKMGQEVAAIRTTIK